MHAYPSEHGADAEALRTLIKEHRVVMVDMGHTHYNELANDGQTIYATTRSTGQIEEGPAGFSIATLDDSVVSWKFKPIGEWPLVMITSPSDHRLIVNPACRSQVVSGSVEVRARVWGSEIESVTLHWEDGRVEEMSRGEYAIWSSDLDSKQLSDGVHPFIVRAHTTSGRLAEDKILVLVRQDGKYDSCPRKLVDYENAFDAWPEKHILGTQLGPNENGHGWPSRRRLKSDSRSGFKSKG
jgi:hypothetical protein